MLTVIVLFLFAATVAFDFVPGIKEQSRKDNIVYGAFVLAGFVVLLLYSFNIRVPGPTEPIRRFMEAVFMAK
jgi:hypothetical protein